MKKMMLIVAAFSMVAMGRAQAVDCDQGDDSNSFENGFQIQSGSDYENADDFLVSAGNTLNVQTISLNILANEPIDQIEFVFYDDNNGAPGNVLPQSVINSPDSDHQILIGEAFGFNAYQIYVDVNLDFEGGANGATYWMQPKATAPAGVVNVFWEVTSIGSLGTPINGREFGGPWIADEDGNQAVFKLYCDQTDPPEPPILPCNFDISFDIEPITSVVFSDINNTSSAIIDGTPALEDFTAIEGNIEQGTAYTITLKGNTNGGFTNYFTVFIDYTDENDGEWIDFDVFEIGSIMGSTGEDAQEATGTITLAESVPNGTYTMRVIKSYGDSPLLPCSSYSYGQAEDYTLIVSNGMAAEEYCIPVGASNGGDEILNFTLADLSNDSDPSEGVDGYMDYSESVDPANIQAGETYIASLTSGTGSLLHGAAIWIDYNDDGVFSASEMVASIPVSIEAETTVDFPPFTVEDFPGTHRLRVQYAFNVNGADMDPCVVTNFTETEDYSVEIAEMEGCVGTPDAGVAIADFSVCANESFNLSVTGATSAANGLERTWESSLAGEGIWSEISGANGSSYVVADGITVPMDYRYKLSCNEEDPVFSDVISVTLNPIADCYCIPYFIMDCFLDDMIDDFILVGEEGTSINDEGTGCSVDGYDDRTDESVTLNQGTDYTATVTSGATMNSVAIWIDFNDDGYFDESERVAAGDLDDSNDLTLSIPANANPGEHRMRAMIAFMADPLDNEDFDSCNDAGNDLGETHDYTVNILELEVEYDCPDLEVNIGDTCDDGDEMTENDMYNEDCECVGTPIEEEFDCPDLEVNIGDTCDDGDDMTENDMYNEDCECVGTPIEVEFDCPDLEANIGDDCIDEETEQAGEINEDCECEPTVGTEDLTDFTFNMYPNPAGRNESITLISNQSIDRYVVLDITGKQVDAKSIPSQNEVKIELKNYGAGMYILKAYSGSEFSMKKMIVK